MTHPEAAPPAPPSYDPTRPPGPPPFWAYVPPPPPRPPWRRARRVCTVLALVGVLVVAAAAVVAVQAYRTARTPESAVRAYFAALARGDAATALAAGPVPEGGRLLVTRDVLRATLAVAPIGDVTTGAVTRTGDTATVAVRYRLGGTAPQEVDDDVDLVRVDDRWQLRRSAVPVSLAVDDASSWAAVPADTPFAVPSDTQLVFPGAVPVVYRTPMLEVDPTTRAVRLAAVGNTVKLAAQLSEQGRSTVTSTVVAALTACGKGGSGVDPYCPQPAAGRAEGVTLRPVPQSFAGTLRDLDRLELDLAVGPDSAGSLSVSGSVDATGAWQVLDYDNVAQRKSGATTITFGGTVPIGAPTVMRWERA